MSKHTPWQEYNLRVQAQRRRDNPNYDAEVEARSREFLKRVAAAEQDEKKPSGESLSKAIPAEAWQKAFASQTVPLTHDAFELLVRQAAETAGVDLGTTLEDTYEPIDVMRDVLDSSAIGSIGICFPNSTFGGDEIAVSISRFPGNTVVGLLHSSWGSEPRIVFILSSPSLKAVTSAAESAIYEVYDCSEWTFFDEGEDVSKNESDQTPAQWYGFSNLKTNWKNQPRQKSGY